MLCVSVVMSVVISIVMSVVMSVVMSAVMIVLNRCSITDDLALNH